MQGQNREKMTQRYGIALGANLDSTFGTALQTLKESLRLFSGESLKVRAQSRWYSTPAFPAGSGPNFVNAAVLVETKKHPPEVLAALHRIEQTLGRTRENRWEPRICDLDIVFCDDLVLPDRETYDHWRNLGFSQQKSESPEDLILPHPRLQERAFVLVPLRDVALGWRHPVSGLDISEMLAALPADEIAEIAAIEG